MITFTRRTLMKAYPVLETELKNISNLNTQVTTFSSVASALLALPIGIWTNAAFATDALPPVAAVLAKFFAPCLCVLSIVFIVLACLALKSKNETWEAIERATHEGVMKIGGLELRCAVLADGRRLITQSGFMLALGRARQAKGREYYKGDVNLPAFLTANNLKPFISNDLEVTSSQYVRTWAIRTLAPAGDTHRPL